MDLFPVAFLIDGLSVYKNLKKDPVITYLRDCVIDLNKADSLHSQLNAAQAYASLCAALYESEYKGSLPDYVFDLILYDCNVFSKACAENMQGLLSREVYAAAENDLHALFKISEITSKMIKDNFLEKCQGLSFLEDSLPAYASEQKVYPVREDWGREIETISGFYESNGVGIYAKYSAFVYEPQSGIRQVFNPDPINLKDLKKYEKQRSLVMENTLAFINDFPYSNVLLYGDRGTGKSSTIKAVLNEYKDLGLHMVQISKNNIIHLDKLIESLHGLPLKFIIFIDDLTFNESDDNFGVLKAILEGSLSVCPKNIAIYATTNRRHIIKESFSSREGDEVHMSDAMDEALSLSDRFGMTVTFLRPDKGDFLDIVCQLAEDCNLEIDQIELCAGAEKFALKHNGRTPRLARQYVDYVKARMELGLEF